MLNLFDAIFARWTAKMDGRILYHTEAKKEATFPYNTVSLVSNVPDSDIKGFEENYEDYYFQFNLFSKNAESTEVGTTFELLKEAFDKFDLVIVDSTTISLRRGSSNLIRVEKIWQLNVTYKIVTKN